MQAFKRDALPPTEEFRLYQKRHLTQAVRVEGPFQVETSEGPVECQDGWLAIDSRGWPYPIAADEFEAIYQPAL